MIVTIRVKENDHLVADDIENFKIYINSKEKLLTVFHNNEDIGTFAEVIGIDIDEFINLVAKEIKG